LRQYDIAMTIDMVKWIQQRNHRAYLSHRRRRFHLIA
jgi:hypothetical protein